jgi:hypothetical protein
LLATPELLLTPDCRNRKLTMSASCNHNKALTRQESGALALAPSGERLRGCRRLIKVGASDSFFVAAPAGGRISWLRSRPGVRGGQTYETDNKVQIGPCGPPHPFGRVGLVVRDTGASRRPEGRVCWRPGVQRPGHLAGERKNWALTPFVNSVLPASPRGGKRPTDTPTIRNMPRAEPQYGQA